MLNLRDIMNVGRKEFQLFLLFLCTLYKLYSINLFVKKVFGLFWQVNALITVYPDHHHDLKREKCPTSRYFASHPTPPFYTWNFKSHHHCHRVDKMDKGNMAAILQTKSDFFWKGWKGNPWGQLDKFKAGLIDSVFGIWDSDFCI